MTTIIKKQEKQANHPYVEELKSQYHKGEITRRQFLRNATLLGMSAAGAYAFTTGIFPNRAKAASIQRGGTWTCAMALTRLDHPARATWVQSSNVYRQICEYLTETGPDNVSRPWLLEKWEASDDVKTWDLYLRKGVKFNNGDELTADDVMFTIKEWLNKDVGSSMYGLLSYWGGPQNVEKVNDYHVRLHLQSPNIGVPEHLFHYPGVILHRGFDGDITKKPVGTGPFTLEEYAEGERMVFKRRNNYWRKGADGKPLPYLDKVIYVSMSPDAALAGLQSGQVDSMFRPRPSDFQALKGVKGIKIIGVDTANVFPIYMRVDVEPWKDNRVRTALKKCQNREKVLQIAALNEGALGIDAHMAPVHPEYCKKPIPEYDPKGAKELLQAYANEKGIKLPLRVTLTSKNDEQEPEIAQVLKQTAEPAGFDIKLDLTEPSAFWDRWMELDFEIIRVTHRPLATMLLPLTYVKGGSWNCSRWYDDEFTRLLGQAERTLDVEKRRQIMCRMEDIQQERGSIGISYWARMWEVCSSKFHNIIAHPSSYHTFTRDAWREG